MLHNEQTVRWHLRSCWMLVANTAEQQETFTMFYLTGGSTVPFKYFLHTSKLLYIVLKLCTLNCKNKTIYHDIAPSQVNKTLCYLWKLTWLSWGDLFASQASAKGLHPNTLSSMYTTPYKHRAGTLPHYSAVHNLHRVSMAMKHYIIPVDVRRVLFMANTSKSNS